MLFETEETEMKRILSVVLMIAMLMVGFCSCEMADLGSKEPETEQHIHAFSPATCAAPKTCTGCGYTEGEKLNRHAPNGDICSVCGLDFFEELANLIKEHENDGDDRTICYQNVDNEIYYKVYYLEEYRSILISARPLYEKTSDETAIIDYTVTFTKGAMLTQSYSWDYSYVASSGGFFHLESAEGTFDPREFTAGIYLEWTSYDNCNPSSINTFAAVYIDDAINKAFIPLLEMSDKNLRPSDYGFVNYD